MASWLPSHLTYLITAQFAYADVRDYRRLETLVVDNRINWVIHLSAILSATGEKIPQQAIELNNVGIQVTAACPMRISLIPGSSRYLLLECSRAGPRPQSPCFLPKHHRGFRAYNTVSSSFNPA